jgi:ribosomal protein S18 acetylase RimI-like enzyme
MMSMTSIELRELAPRHLAPVAALEAAVNPAPWSLRLFEEELALPPGSRHWLVAVDRPDLAAGHGAQGVADATTTDSVVGFGGIMFADTTAHLMSLGVDPARQGQGIGRRLCAALFSEARRRGAAELTLEVRVSNRRASGLYERTLAMTPVGIRPRYYTDGEDAMIYWLHDLQGPEMGQRLKTLEVT